MNQVALMTDQDRRAVNSDLGGVGIGQLDVDGEAPPTPQFRNVWNACGTPTLVDLERHW